jgi:hypothetical protein
MPVPLAVGPCLLFVAVAASFKFDLPRQGDQLAGSHVPFRWTVGKADISPGTGGGICCYEHFQDQKQILVDKICYHATNGSVPLPPGEHRMSCQLEESGKVIGRDSVTFTVLTDEFVTKAFHQYWAHSSRPDSVVWHGVTTMKSPME